MPFYLDTYDLILKKIVNQKPCLRTYIDKIGETARWDFGYFAVVALEGVPVCRREADNVVLFSIYSITGEWMNASKSALFYKLAPHFRSEGCNV